MKFKFNYLYQTLAYQPSENELWTEITETFEGKFASLGFKLTEGRITFSIRPHKIQVFLMKFNNYAAKCFKKDLPKHEEIIFTFEQPDEVEKVNDKWVKKGGSHD